MRHSLHSHIIFLENSIQDVENRLTQPSLTPEELEDLHLQLTLAQGALEHYRQAYELELSLSGSEPPSQAGGGESDSGGEKPEKPNPPQTNQSLATIKAGARKRAALTGRKQARGESRSLSAPQPGRQPASKVR